MEPYRMGPERHILHDNEISDELIGKFQLKLAPNEEMSFQLIVGYIFDPALNARIKFWQKSKSK